MARPSPLTLLTLPQEIRDMIIEDVVSSFLPKVHPMIGHPSARTQLPPNQATGLLMTSKDLRLQNLAAISRLQIPLTIIIESGGLAYWAHAPCQLPFVSQTDQKNVLERVDLVTSTSFDRAALENIRRSSSCASSSGTNGQTNSEDVAGANEDSEAGYPEQQAQTIEDVHVDLSFRALADIVAEIVNLIEYILVIGLHLCRQACSSYRSHEHEACYPGCHIQDLRVHLRNMPEISGALDSEFRKSILDYCTQGQNPGRPSFKLCAESLSFWHENKMVFHYDLSDLEMRD